MKQLFMLFCFVPAFWITANGQESTQTGSKDPQQGRFWAGLNYTYAHSDMKLFSRTEHAIWQGLDYGTDTLSDDEISSINSIARFTSENNSICIEAGMNLLERPDFPWHINGRVAFGITQTKYETEDRNLGTTDLRVVSPFSRINSGVEFDFAYLFNDHWGVAACPLFNYAWGTATDIDDRLDEQVPDMTEDRSEKSGTALSRLSLLARYRIKGLTFSAGPGFYLIYNRRTYSVELTNTETGSTHFNESRSVFYNSSFADATISIDWKITSGLDVSLYCGIGEDIIIHPAIRYFF